MACRTVSSWCLCVVMSRVSACDLFIQYGRKAAQGDHGSSSDTTEPQITSGTEPAPVMPWKLLSFLSDFSHLITNLGAKHCWHGEMIYWLLDAFNSFLIKIYDICQAYDSLVWTALLSTTRTNSQISKWEVSVESWSKLHIYFTRTDITGYVSLSLFQCGLGHNAGSKRVNGGAHVPEGLYGVRGQCQTPDAWHSNELPLHSPCQDALALERLTLSASLSLSSVSTYSIQPMPVGWLGPILVCIKD